MKKNYTIFLLLLTFSVFAQNKIKETSVQGVYFKENNGKIDVQQGTSPISSSSRFQYSEDGTLAVVTGNRSRVPSPSSFSSPNEVIATQDAAGNKYWYLIDGTLAKSEIVSGNNTSAVKETKSSETTKSAAPVVTKPEAPKAEEPIKTTETPVQPEAVAPVIQDIPSVVGEGQGKKIIIEEIEQPKQEITETITEVQAVPTDEAIEEIQVTKSEVGDVSDLFEKNYEDMSRKEKKLYKKNEKKIMKQLEKELKSKKDEEE